MRRISILIVDDHPIVRAGLRQVLEAHGFHVCADTGEAGEVLALIGRHEPDIVVLDLALKDSNGFEVARAIAAEYAGLPVLILSMHDEKLYAPRALQAGARGFVSKNSPADEILRAINELLQGETYVNKSVMEQVDLGETTAAEAAKLTNRELQVLELLGEGLAPRHIAAELNLSVSTIEVYRERLKSKLSLDDAAALSRFAVSWAKERDRSL